MFIHVMREQTFTSKKSENRIRLFRTYQCDMTYNYQAHNENEKKNLRNMTAADNKSISTSSSI